MDFIQVCVFHQVPVSLTDSDPFYVAKEDLHNEVKGIHIKRTDSVSKAK